MITLKHDTHHFSLHGKLKALERRHLYKSFLFFMCWVLVWFMGYLKLKNIL